MGSKIGDDVNVVDFVNWMKHYDTISDEKYDLMNEVIHRLVKEMTGIKTDRIYLRKHGLVGIPTSVKRVDFDGNVQHGMGVFRHIDVKPDNDKDLPGGISLVVITAEEKEKNDLLGRIFTLHYNHDFSKHAIKITANVKAPIFDDWRNGIIRVE